MVAIAAFLLVVRFDGDREPTTGIKYVNLASVETHLNTT